MDMTKGKDLTTISLYIGVLIVNDIQFIKPSVKRNNLRKIVN